MAATDAQQLASQLSLRDRATLSRLLRAARERGRQEGHEIAVRELYGNDLVLDLDHAVQRVVSMANTPDLDVLYERSGSPRLAARIRQIWAENGLEPCDRSELEEAENIRHHETREAA